MFVLYLITALQSSNFMLNFIMKAFALSEVMGLKSQNWHSHPRFGAAAMDVPLQCQAFRYFSLSCS